VERAAKRELVSTLNGVFNNTSVVVVAHYAGLTVADMQKLRGQMKQVGATVKVAKNSLAKIALEGTDVASISGLMKGPTLIAYSSDRRQSSPAFSGPMPRQAKRREAVTSTIKLFEPNLRI
jgi:large subunit ribosomal protein L10